MAVKKDFDLIVHKLPTEMSYVNVYPIGDVHIGSDHFNEKAFFGWKKAVEADPNGVVVIVGDLMDNGLKNSKTNSYEQLMRPRDQKQWLKTQFQSLADAGKIIGACTGNHEYRSSQLTDECPLYDIMAKLDIEHLYRENMAFIKVAVGEKNKERQFSYNLVLAHGNSRGKTETFGYAIDGMDVFVTGHTHQPTSRFPAKIVIDSRNENVYMSGFCHVNVPSFQEFGGYALKGMYMPQDSKYPVIRLNGERKEVNVLWV